jgi:alkylhydroperoxidase family enzyme
MGPVESSRATAIAPIGYEELPAVLAAAFGPRVERLGYLGEFFQRTAHQPAALLAFHQFTESCKEALGQRLTELVALTASVRLGNDYERNQHERLSLRRGRSRDWVSTVEQLDPAAAGEALDEHDRRAQEVVLALLRDHGRTSRPVVEAYARRHGAPEAVALLLLVGRYLSHSTVVNALELRAPVASIFEDGFGAG